MERTLRRIIAVLVLTLFTAGSAEALGPAARPRAGLLEAAWAWLASRVVPVFEKAGSEMDPNGAKLHEAPPPPASTDAGSDMDPDGFL
jgi:hypothetical protein